jgi:hypothetical protein
LPVAAVAAHIEVAVAEQEVLELQQVLRFQQAAQLQ